MYIIFKTYIHKHIHHTCMHIVIHMGIKSLYFCVQGTFEFQMISISQHTAATIVKTYKALKFIVIIRIFIMFQNEDSAKASRV